MLQRIQDGRTTEPAIKALMELIDSGKKRGDMITYAEIEKAADCQRSTGHFTSVCSALRKAVLDKYKWALKAAAGEGYMIPTDEQQATYAIRGTRAKIDGIRKDLNAIMATDDDKLSEPMQKNKQHYAMNTAAFLQMEKLKIETPRLTLKRSDTAPQMKLKEG